MNEELEKILNNLSDAGCGSEELQKAEQLYEAGAVRTDLYDGGGKDAIPFDKLDAFFTEHLQ